MVEMKRHEPDVYKLYDFLKKEHLGEENGITRPLLAAYLGISERTLRKLTKQINESPVLDKIVSTSHCCYMCNTKKECIKAINNTYRVAITLLKKAKNMERKLGLNGQVKLHLGDYYKDFVETFEE